jgi:tripartite-type tricarboxylate transporter receptor subunit TctC
VNHFLCPSRRQFLARSGAGAFMTMLGSSGLAAGWPNAPVRIIVGTPVGGSPDANTRAVAEVIAQQHRQAFRVENRVGANGLLAFQALQASPADGNTLAYFSQWNFYSMVLMQRTEVLDSFDYVTRMFDAPSLIVVGEKAPYASLGDLLDAARKAPGRLNYGSGGIGSPAHVGMAKLLLATKTEMQHVPFKGGAETAQALVGGQLDCGMVIPATVRALLESKRLRPLAVTTRNRLPIMPNVPTVNEAAGIKDYEVTTWGGYVVRKGVPKPVLDMIYAAMAGAAKSPEVLEQVAKGGGNINLSRSPEEFARFYLAERAEAADLLKAIGLTPSN